MAAPTLRQLRYFAALAETLHFARAAERCHVSQPALSMQVRELEAALGVRLVERAPSGVLLTAEGEEVARRGRDIVLAVADLADFARRRGRVLAGRLRLGVIPSIGPYLLPRVLPGLHAAYPDLELSLRETKTRDLVAALVAGGLDLLILALPVADEGGGVETMPLFEDAFALAVHAADPLAGRERVHQSELTGGRLLLLEEGHCLRDQALALCPAPGAAADGDDFRASSLATVVQMVANGYGRTILPDLALPVEVGGHAGIRVVRFADPVPTRTVGLAWRAASPRKADFVAFGRFVAGAANQAAAGAPATAEAAARRA